MHVTAACEEDASRAATLLTDALRTASLPGANDGRMVVIRRLALGRICSHVSPATLALHIEQAAARVAADAVAFDLPTAAFADAVVFPDRARPLVALARLHARHAPTDTWFWRAVVPRWAACATRDERWLLLFESAHVLPEAAIVAGAMVSELVAAGVEHELLLALPPGRGAAWLRRAGWSSFNLADGQPPAHDTCPLPGLAIAYIIEHIDALDDRVVWLTTMLAVHEARVRIEDANLPTRIAYAIRGALAATDLPRATISGASRSEKQDIADRVPAPASRSDFTSLRQGEPTTAPAEPAFASDQHTIEATPGVERPGFFTPYAGVFLLVTILTRLGFATFLASRGQQLENNFPMRLLWFIAARLGLTSDDPLATLLNTPQKVDLERRDLHTMWLSALRHWCKRHRIPLKTLVCRPGRVYATATHVDVTFDLSHLETRVRRLAIDVDPGWVRWLGRVVAFHYTDPFEHHG